MASITKVTRNYQITIPEEVRMHMKIAQGDEIVFEHADFGFRIHKIQKGKIKDFVGLLREFKKGVSSTEIQRRWREEFER